MRALLFAALLALALPAGADTLRLCYHYGCALSSDVELSPATLQSLRQQLRRVHSPADERQALQQVVLGFYASAAAQTPIAMDKGGNGEDEATPGRMDCIDHSRNLATLLDWLDSHELLRFHRPAGIVQRAPLIFNQHYAAALQDNDSGTIWVMDSWFRDFGAPPVVVPLAIWKEGFSP